MLEKIIRSGKKALQTFGLALSLYACGNTVINNYINSERDGSVQRDSTVELNDSGSDGNYSLSDAATDSTSLTNSCLDLSQYPDFFVVDGIFNGYFVLGERAAAVDNLTMTDIASSMKYINDLGELVPVVVGDATRLDSEITDIYAQNLIVIGDSCSNTISQRLLGLPDSCGIGRPACNTDQCLEGLSPGKARIKLFDYGNGNLAMLVAGYSGDNTRLAGRVIAHRSDELRGTEVQVEGTTLSDARILYTATLCLER